MANVPRYQRRETIPGHFPARGGSFAVAASPGIALSNLGEEITREASAQLEARRVNELSRLQLEAAKQFDEFDRAAKDQTDWSRIVPDYEAQLKAMRGRMKDIKDPRVREIYNRDFEKMALRGLTKARDLAEAREKIHNQTTLSNTLDDYADLVAQADDFEQASGRIINARMAISGTVAAGTIDELKGAELDRQFTDAAHLNFIKREILEDPKRVHEDLQAGRYEGIDEALKTDLLKYSHAMAEARAREEIQLENQRIRAQEKALKQAQEENAMTLTILALSGQLTEPKLLEAGRKRMIDNQDLIAITNVIKRGEGGEDDYAVRLEIFDGILEGTHGRRQILGAVGNGLSVQTAEKYLEKVRQRDEEGDISKSPEYKDAESYIRNMLKTTGIMDKFDTSELPRIENALDEFRTRTKSGENIREVRDDIVNRFRPTAIKPAELPRPLFGNKDDPVSAFERTRSKYLSGEIDETKFRRETRNLYELLMIQDRQPAPTQQSGEEVKKKIKKRESAW